MKIVTTMAMFGIVAAIAAVSAKAQEGCDGPVLVTGYLATTCGLCYESVPHCLGSTTVRNDYLRCGGSGYTSCSSMNDTVGHWCMPCTETPDYIKAAQILSAYTDCQCKNNSDPPPIPVECHPLQFCGTYGYITCSVGTTGGTPMTAQVLYSLGDYTGCIIAKLQKSPSPSVVELALVILKSMIIRNVHLA